MRASLKISRGLQLIGALLLVLAIVRCSTDGVDGSGFVGGFVAAGLALVIGARIYEWLTKE